MHNKAYIPTTYYVFLSSKISKNFNLIRCHSHLHLVFTYLVTVLTCTAQWKRKSILELHKNNAHRPESVHHHHSHWSHSSPFSLFHRPLPRCLPFLSRFVGRSMPFVCLSFAASFPVRCRFVGLSLLSIHLLHRLSFGAASFAVRCHVVCRLLAASLPFLFAYSSVRTPPMRLIVHIRWSTHEADCAHQVVPMHIRLIVLHPWGWLPTTGGTDAYYSDRTPPMMLIESIRRILCILVWLLFTHETDCTHYKVLLHVSLIVSHP